jgi:AcrR family transcriptional regulator
VQATVRRKSRHLPRKLPKQARAQETVEAILTATAHILVRHGFEAASTNRIAERAGVSIGSLYQYFPSKDALVAALLERHVQEMLAVARDGLAQASARSIRQRAREMIRVMLQAHAVEPELHRVFMEEMPYANRMQAIAEMERMFEELAKASLERNRATIRPRNLDIAAFVLVQAVEALTHAAVVHRPELLQSEEFVDETTELIVRYLAPDRVRPARSATR